MTPLSVAAYTARIGRNFARETGFVERPIEKIMRLEAENKSLSRQVHELTHELLLVRQCRRKSSDGIGVADVLDAVSQYYRVTPLSIISARKSIKRDISARQIVCYLAYELTGQTLRQIGDALGGRDHSTVSHAVEKIGKLRTTDSQLDVEIVEIIHALDCRAEKQGRGGNDKWQQH